MRKLKVFKTCPECGIKFMCRKGTKCYQYQSNKCACDNCSAISKEGLKGTNCETVWMEKNVKKEHIIYT